MQYTYAIPSQYNLGAIHALLAAKSLPGFTGMATENNNLIALFSTALGLADKTTLDNAIAGYTYAVPAPLPSFGQFEASVHTDPNMTDAILGAFFGDTAGRGNLLMAALQFAVASGDYTRVNRLYSALKTTPPTGMTTADMQAIGQHAADAHFPITP